MRSAHKAVDGTAGCGQIVGKSAGRGQKKLARVRVAHKVVDHVVAPERVERRTLKNSRSCEK